MEEPNNLEPNYSKVIKLHFNTGVNLVQVVIEGIVNLLISVVTYTMLNFSKNMVEIAGHSIIFIAPIPNSMTVYRTLNKAGYGTAGGWSGAIAVELVLFFTIEGALLILSRFIQDQKNYKVAFYSMTGAVVLGTVSVVGLVAYLEIAEGGMPVLAIMPVFSFLAFVTVAVKRWLTAQDEAKAALKAEKRLDRMAKKQPATSNKPAIKPATKPIAPVADSQTEPDGQAEFQRSMLVVYQAEPTISDEKLADRLGKSKRFVQLQLADLVAKDVVHVAKQGRGKIVTLNGTSAQFLEGFSNGEEKH